MAASRRSSPADGGRDEPLQRAVAALLREALPEGALAAVALSGGRDSIALLDAAAAAAHATRHRLAAFHVHHGLSPHADGWAAFCARACAARGVAFALVRVGVDARGDGIEAAARARRYEALALLAREHRADAVLLAHHADDQAETILLQLLRGAGVHGLAGMAATTRRAGVLWLRPLLALPRSAIDDYVARHALAYVDDESNASPRLRRNALRAQAVPTLRMLAPGYPATLARAARHQAEAACLLDDLAAIDAAVACDGRSLDSAALRTLPVARARNLLRWFLRTQGLRAPSATRLAELLRQVAHAPADARVELAHDGARIGVHRGRVVVHRPACATFARDWRGERDLVLPHGVLTFTPTLGSGIAARSLATGPVVVRGGSAGERLHVLAGGRRRNVADLLREAAVPAWERLALPRLYCGDALAAVARAGVDRAFAAAPGEAAFTLDWRPAGSP